LKAYAAGVGTTQTRYRIAEVAERSGYSPPTLRYYEDIGLLPSAERSDNGYRTYDQATVERLGFITRAKQLGCSLAEIADLVRMWEAGECAPVQHGLRGLIDTKVGDAQGRIAELTALLADLQGVKVGLGLHTPDGPCDDRCGCTSRPDGETTPQSVASTAKATAATDGDPPVTCTLGAGSMGQRLGDWRALLAHVQERTPLDGGVRLNFEPDAPVDAIARLAAAEEECCRFFGFALTIDQRGIALEVRAPADGQEVLAALFGSAG
jgi:MerR family copper efflux transcriptional regulator